MGNHKETGSAPWNCEYDDVMKPLLMFGWEIKELTQMLRYNVDEMREVKDIEAYQRLLSSPDEVGSTLGVRMAVEVREHLRSA